MIGGMGTRELMEWIKTVFDYLTPGITKTALGLNESKNVCSYHLSSARAHLIGNLFLSLDIPRLNRKWDNVRAYSQYLDSGQGSKKLHALLKKCQFDRTLAARLKIEPILFPTH